MNGEAASRTASDKRYYWLKLPKDFFDRPDIRMLMGSKAGTWYVYAYIRLLCESIGTGGRLLVREDMPHTVQTLRLSLRTGERRIREFLAQLRATGLLREDEACMVLTDMTSMVGSETYAAARMRRLRAAKGVGDTILPTVDLGANNVRECYVEIDKEIDKEKEIELESERARESEKEKEAAGSPTAETHARAQRRLEMATESVPSLAEVEAYVRERGYGFSAKHFFSYYAARGWRLCGVAVADWRALADSWQTRPQGEEGRAPPGRERYGNFDVEEAFERAVARAFPPRGGDGCASADGK